MFLKPAFFGIALLGAITPSLAEAIDDSTKCAVVRDPMDSSSLDGQKSRELGQFIFRTLVAIDGANGSKGNVGIGVVNYVVMDTLAGCRDHPDTTVRDMTIEAYERFRLIETGVRPPDRESLRPINVEMRIVSVEAVTKRDPTDIRWFDNDRPRSMLKVTLASPANLSELKRKFRLTFSGDARLCRDDQSGDAGRLAPSSVMFDAESFASSGRREESAAKENYIYRLYFDLIRDPQDICIRISSGSLYGYRAVFNNLRISDDALREALNALK